MPEIDLKNSVDVTIDGLITKQGDHPLIHVSGSRTGETVFENVGITQPEKQIIIEKMVPTDMVKVVK